MKVLCDDVKVLDIASLGDIDGFAYGFPCNDFSIAGESKGFDGEFGGLYKYGIKVIDKYNPSFFIAENVGGITSSNGGKAFLKILQDLKNCYSNLKQIQEQLVVGFISQAKQVNQLCVSVLMVRVQVGVLKLLLQCLG